MLKYKINIATISSASTATTINIPINMEYQLVDQGELIETVFVAAEVEKAINPILDYEKVRLIPTGSTVTSPYVNHITYNVNFVPSGTTVANANTYASIGFTDDDIKFEKHSFTETFLNLSFYDSDNALSQRLVSFITIFSNLTTSDLYPLSATTGVPGQPLPAAQVYTNFVLSNPILFPNGFTEGYYLYDYKDTIPIGGFKYLYMRGTFNNAKNGVSTNLMVENKPYPIDDLVHKLYTRYILYRNATGYYYEIDTTYQNNASYSGNDVVINLYQIQST